MISNLPIGVFDSGIGGLSIAKRIRDTLANESILYVADTRYAPYGDKSNEFIIQRSVAIANFLVKRGVKAIVVACNTATTSAIHQLRALHKIPIIGVEPGTKPAALNSKTGVVGVLATPRTLATESFDLLLKRTTGPVRVELQACPDLVMQVESLDLDSKETISLVESYVTPLLEKGVDHIVLGCTHYNYLEAVIAQIAGPNVSIVNTVQAVTNQVARQLNHFRLLNRSGTPGYNEFWTSGDSKTYKTQIEKLWGDCEQVYELDSSYAL